MKTVRFEAHPDTSTNCFYSAEPAGSPPGLYVPEPIARVLEAALIRLANAADAYAADQAGATDSRCGLVQPISVAEGEELLAALEQASTALAAAEGEAPL